MTHEASTSRCARLLIRGAEAVLTGMAGAASRSTPPTSASPTASSPRWAAASSRRRASACSTRPTAVVYPGWVNTHHHLFQSLLKGVPAGIDATLTPWLKAVPYALSRRLRRSHAARGGPHRPGRTDAVGLHHRGRPPLHLLPGHRLRPDRGAVRRGRKARRALHAAARRRDADARRRGRQPGAPAARDARRHAGRRGAPRRAAITRPGRGRARAWRWRRPR